MEFVLVLPWLVACFLSILAVAIWVLIGQLMQYRSYQAARGVGVYEQKSARMKIKIKGLKSPIITDAPVHFALEGETSDLSSQGSPSGEFKKIPLMDNPIGFCGNQGEYGLCGH